MLGCPKRAQLAYKPTWIKNNVSSEEKGFFIHITLIIIKYLRTKTNGFGRT